jgi:hypothetical protein
MSIIAFAAQGGLGNQLFQYATARCLALRHQCPLVVDHHWFMKPPAGVTKRQLELSQYPVAFRLASAAELLSWTPMRSRLGPYLGSLLPMKVLREREHCINEAVLSASKNTYLFGYWQSEKYFADIRAQLVSDFTPIAKPGSEDSRLIAEMRGGQSVSVHVRRGDYISSASTSAYHGTCSVEYYRRAVSYIAERVQPSTLFVFSDDPEWARKNLKFSFKTTYVVHNGPDNAVADLRLMSYCQHHVIANSSFSWWGAWLANKAGQIVVAPAKWYRVDRPTPDLCPSNWVRL